MRRSVLLGALAPGLGAVITLGTGASDANAQCYSAYAPQLYMTPAYAPQVYAPRVYSPYGGHYAYKSYRTYRPSYRQYGYRSHHGVYSGGHYGHHGYSGHRYGHGRRYSHHR